MRTSYVLSHFPHQNQIIQVKIHASGWSNQPHGRTHVDWSDPLLHACGLEIENEGYLYALQLAHHQPVYHLLPIKQKSWGSLEKTQWKEVPELMSSLQYARRWANQSFLTVQKGRIQDISELKPNCSWNRRSDSQRGHQLWFSVWEQHLPAQDRP